MFSSAGSTYSLEYKQNSEKKTITLNHQLDPQRVLFSVLTTGVPNDTYIVSFVICCAEIDKKINT